MNSTQVSTELIPVNKIKAASDFNCRGDFLLQDVKELASQIKEYGLLQPVVVRPDGDDYQLLAGFRRFAAVSQILKRPCIEAKVVHVNDHQAAVINLIENIERKNLNPVQEARQLEKLYPESQHGCRTVAEAVNRTTQWVLVRRLLLKMPQNVQNMVAAGRIPVSRIPDLRDSQDPLALAEQLSKRVHVRQPLPGVRRRNKADVKRMIVRLMQLKFDPFVTKLLAWVNGYRSDEEINHDIEIACRDGYSNSSHSLESDSSALP